MNEDLYILVSELFPCNLIYEIETRYPNAFYHHITNILKKYWILVCMIILFSSLPSIVPSKFDYTIKALQFLEHSGILYYPSMKIFHLNTGFTKSAKVKKSSQPASMTSFTPSKLHTNIVLYKDIFSIQYTPKTQFLVVGIYSK